jgi:hypothetical protein
MYMCLRAHVRSDHYNNCTGNAKEFLSSWFACLTVKPLLPTSGYIIIPTNFRPACAVPDGYYYHKGKIVFF